MQKYILLIWGKPQTFIDRVLGPFDSEDGARHHIPQGTHYSILPLTKPDRRGRGYCIRDLRARQISVAKKHSTNEWRVNFLRGKEATAYYTPDFDDAIGTGHLMANQRDKR
jgi:hypothetical protein